MTMTTSPALAKLMARWFEDFQPGSFIDGRLRPGTGAPVEVVNPATGQTLCTYASAQADLVDEAARSARRAQKEWMALPGFERGERMARFARLIAENAEALAQLEAVNVGRPIRDARGEAAAAARMIGWYAGWCDKQYGDVIPVPTTHLNYTRREPYGVVLQITPWNAPIVTSCWQIGPALATGNAPLLKPSELTPFSSLAIARLAIDAGLPAGLFNVLCGTGLETGQSALRHPLVRKVVFVGSPKQGRAIAATAAERAIPSLLELGGKSANIVFADADIDKAIVGAQAAVFAASGQSCVAGSRLLVDARIHDEFVDTLARATARLETGDPLDENTRIGPIQNAAQYGRVKSMTEAGVAEGAQMVTGGAMEGDGFFFRPTILSHVTPEMDIAREEIFGPVVSVIPFADEEEAVAIAADSNFGLAGAVWTRDVGRAHRVAHAVPAGTFWINSYKTINVMSPFGGFHDSGYGRSSGREALEEYTQVKSIWVETAAEPLQGFGYAPE